jgi:hypothetical protein
VSVAGTWDITIRTPLGEQKGKLTVTPDGAGGFTGRVWGGPGEMAIAGNVDGDRLTWRMTMDKPMPMKLDCHALVEGDTLTGGLKAGIFGTMPVTGTRSKT